MKDTVIITSNKFNSDGPETIGALAGALQDMWHYAALIAPGKDRTSTFEGCREYAGQAGKCRAYEALLGKIDAWSMDYLPAFCELALLDPKKISSLEEMIAEVNRFWFALAIVANENNIDPYSGQFKREYILTDGSTESERRMLTQDEADELNREAMKHTAGTWWWAANVNPSGRASSTWGLR